MPVPYATIVGGGRGPFVLLSVDDEGRGVPDEHKERIFNKFHQIERGTRIRGQGVGLGLAISRQIVEGHGGAVWVEDRAGGGASFRVLLPSVPPRGKGVVEDGIEAAPLPSPARPPALAGVRRSAERALIVLLAVTAAGCGTAAPEVALPPEPPPAAPVSAAPDTPSLVTSSESRRLERAQALLQNGSFEEAGREFQRVLERGPSGAERAEALWGTALVHLFPESPLRDPQRGLQFLAALQDEFPTSMPGVQARWALSMLGELAGARQDAQDQRALLEELNEALDVLRQIDLDRRPSGSAAGAGSARPGSGSSPAPTTSGG